jgi:hypothetical protein
MAASMTLSGKPATTATVNQYYYFKPTLSNGNSSSTRFSITGRPAWANFNATNDVLSGTPTAIGTWSSIKITSRDGTRGASLPVFSLTVKAGTGAVKIAGAPAKSTDAGAYYSFRPTVTAPSGAKLTYSIVNKPAWTVFSSSSGTLTGTPATSGTHYGISIKVTDGKTSATLPTFNIAVAKPGSGTALLSWEKPARNTDGTALSNLAGFRVHYGTSLSALTKTITVGGANSTSASIEGLARGTW